MSAYCHAWRDQKVPKGDPSAVIMCTIVVCYLSLQHGVAVTCPFIFIGDTVETLSLGFPCCLISVIKLRMNTSGNKDARQSGGRKLASTEWLCAPLVYSRSKTFCFQIISVALWSGAVISPSLTCSLMRWTGGLKLTVKRQPFIPHVRMLMKVTVLDCGSPQNCIVSVYYSHKLGQLPREQKQVCCICPAIKGCPPEIISMTP